MSHVLTEEKEKDTRKEAAYSEKVLVYHPDLCTGCTYCMTACSYHHYGVASFEKAYIKILEDPDKPYSFIGAYCSHCETAACIAACPSDAMYKEEKTGIVRVNAMLCIMCQNCRAACPISHPNYDEDLHQAVKCDQCDGNPLCVQQCPTGAITYEDRLESRNKFGVIQDV